MQRWFKRSDSLGKPGLLFVRFKGFLVYIACIIACLVGASIWLGIALGVAMPDKWFTSSFSEVSALFLSDRHYLLVAFLLFVDVGIDIVLLGHEALAKTLTSKSGFGSLLLVVSAMVIPAAAGTDDAHFLIERHLIVFWVEISLFLAFKFLMYKAAHPRIGNHKVQQKLTAVPVQSLNTEA